MHVKTVQIEFFAIEIIISPKNCKTVWFQKSNYILNNARAYRGSMTGAWRGRGGGVARQQFFFSVFFYLYFF
jgi:hypothetical protein